MKQLFRKLNALRVLSFFFENPYSETHLREIARKLKMAPSTVSRSLSALDALIVRREERNATFFKGSMSSGFKALKVAFTIAKIEEAGLVQLITEKSNGLSCILLYGSAAKGEDGPQSDYDLLVIAAQCGITSENISESLGREIGLKKYAIGEWKEISRQNRAFYLEVITNSIVLYGQKPVID